MKKQRTLFITVIAISLLLSILPVIVFRHSAAITVYSIPAIVFFVSSVVFAAVAFSFRERGNLFAYPSKLFYILLVAISGDREYTSKLEYKKEFSITALIFCASIPFYIPIAFFTNGFYSSIMRPLEVSIAREIAIILLGLIPPIIKNISDKNQQRIKDEADRKEQERRESMGKWK